MAMATFNRAFIISKSHYLSFLEGITVARYLHFHPSAGSSPVTFSSASISDMLFSGRTSLSSLKPFCTTSSASTSSENPVNPGSTTGKRNTLVNFSLSDSESDSYEKESATQVSTRRREIDKSKLPPLYDPFNKKPVIEEPEDPRNLQEVFHKIRSDGLINNAVKMFDGLSKDGLTHEALELFSQIKDKGQMPDVVAHTAVIESYANAGQPKEALKVYMRMLGSGVLPNAYTYSVLIKGLLGSGDEKLVKDAKKYVMEMVEKRGIRPNGGVCVGVYEGLVKVGLEEEGREVLEMVKNKGFVPEEKKVREALKDKRGLVYRTIMNVFYGK